MGLLFSRVWEKFSGPSYHKILMVGLDGAGKTTILYKLRLNELVTTIPTVGFNVETVNYKNISFTIWDVGGQDKIRPLWRHYYQNMDAIIFVVDSNDQERLDCEAVDHRHGAKDELHHLLSSDLLRNASLLVYANKQDLPNSLPVKEVTERLGLDTVKNHRWHVQHSCAANGEGLYEGLDWLADALKEKKIKERRAQSFLKY